MGFIPTPPSRSAGVAYAVSTNGHRQPYLDLLAPLLGLESFYGSRSLQTLWRLVKVPKVFFVTFDDDVPAAVFVSLVRGLCNKPTAALFLGPRQCFKTGSLKYRLKYVAFRVIRRVPRLTLLSIVPFAVDPLCALVAHSDVRDPQWWDMHDGTSIRVPSETALSHGIRKVAAGRRVVAMVGSLNRIKGFDFFSEIASHNPGLVERTLLVAAGMLAPECREAGLRFVAAGGLLVDRLLQDDEIESMYRVSDLIWCCYAPDYDHASGIFGRAIQLGVPTVVRRGSVIDGVGASLATPVLKLDYGDVGQGVALVNAEPPPRLVGQQLRQHTDMVGTWRQEFRQRVELALGADGAANLRTGKGV